MKKLASALALLCLVTAAWAVLVASITGSGNTTDVLSSGMTANFSVSATAAGGSYSATLRNRGLLTATIQTTSISSLTVSGSTGTLSGPGTLTNSGGTFSGTVNVVFQKGTGGKFGTPDTMTVSFSYDTGGGFTYTGRVTSGGFTLTP